MCRVVFLALAGLISAAVAANDNATSLDFGERLDAGELASAVLARNPGIEALRASMLAAEYRIGPAGALDDPMLTAGLAPATLDNNPSGRLEISQALPWPGKLDARSDVARAQARAAGEDVESLKLRLRERAIATLARWFEVERALVINAEHQAILADLRAVARSRYAAGRVPQQDVLATDTQIERLKDQALRLESRRHDLRAHLNGLLNRPVSAPLPPPAAPAVPPRAPELGPLIARALERHPELQRLRFTRQAEQAQVRVAELAFKPDFRVSAGYNSLWRDRDLRPHVGVSVNLPLDRGKYRAELDAARAEELRVDWALEDRRASIEAEIAGLHAAVAQAVDSFVLHRERLLPLAKDTLEVALTDYSGGRGAYQDVLNAERARIEAELGLARARAEYLQRSAALQRAAGLPLESIAGMAPGQRDNPMTPVNTVPQRRDSEEQAHE